MKKKWVILSVFCITSVVILMLLGCNANHLLYRRNAPEAINLLQDDIEGYNRINEKILRFSDNYAFSAEENKLVLYVTRENNIVISVKKCYINAPDEDVTTLDSEDYLLLTKLNALLNNDCEYITCDGDRVSYSGIGKYALVYTADNRSPSFFFYEGDKVPFTAYKVSNNWFYLVSHLR